MEIVDERDARPRLSQLVDQALRGGEVLIARDGKALVRLAPLDPDDVPPRSGGQWKGKVRMSDVFDSLPDDLADAFGATPD